MMPKELNQHLSQISTMWTVLRQAHEGSAAEAATAQRLLLERYGSAVHRYLLRLLGDANAADDLLQEFALALISGSLRGADPERKRFRYYVKSVLFHLVSKHRKRQQRQARAVADDGPELAGLTAPGDDGDRAFDETWREQLLNRAWEALSRSQPSFYEVLRFRAEHPKASSEELAEQLGVRLKKKLTSSAARQTLHRAREQFADLLLDEIAHSLDEPTLAQIEEELAQLNLLAYCRPALQRRAPGS